MKKSLIMTLIGCCALFCITTAFDDGNTAQADQIQKIGDMLNERLDAFRIAKEQECKDRAIAAAVTRADEEMAAAKSSKKRRVRKKPTYTTKGSETPATPPPAPSRPATPAAPKDVTKAVEKAATNTGKKTDAVKKQVQEAQKAIEKKGRNTGKKRNN